MSDTNIKELNEKIEKQHNDQVTFSSKKAKKYFFKGLLSPLSSLIKHPIKSLAALAVTYALCSAIPVLIPILTVGLGLFSLYETGKGLLNAYIKYNKRKTDESEKFFQLIGSGITGLGLAVLGLKYNANIVIGAKSYSAEPLCMDNSAKISFLDALKEHFSLFSTSEGRGVISNQFSPLYLGHKFKDLLHFKNSVDSKQFINALTPTLTLPSVGLATKTLLVSSKMFNNKEDRS